MTPCGRDATAAINSAVAGTEPVEPAMIIGPACCMVASRCASARRMALRFRAGEDLPSSSIPRRPEGAGDLKEFSRQLPPERMVLGIEIAKFGPVAIFGLDGIDELGKIARQPYGIRGARRSNERRIRMDVANDLWQLVAPGEDRAAPIPAVALYWQAAAPGPRSPGRASSK